MRKVRALLYPNNWPQLSREIRELCNWRCQACDKQCRRPGEFYLGWQYELTLAHLTQHYDAESITVAALCLPCHLKYDAGFAWVARRRHEHVRRLLAGQLTIPLKMTSK